MDRNKTRELDTVSFLIHFSATVGILHHFSVGAGHRVDASQGSDILIQNYTATVTFLVSSVPRSAGNPWNFRNQKRSHRLLFLGIFHILLDGTYIFVSTLLLAK